MVSWLTLLYVLRSPHKMFFNILGNCYKMFLHFMSGLQCRNGLIADIVVCSSMSQLSHCLHCCMCFNVAMVSLLTLLYVLQCRNGLIADIVVCASMSPWSHGWHYKLKKLYIGPIKCFYILWNCYKMCSRVHSSVHTNNNHPIKWFLHFIEFNGSLQRSPHKMFLHFMDSNVGLQCRHGLMADIVVCSAFIP